MFATFIVRGQGIIECEKAKAIYVIAVYVLLLFTVLFACILSLWWSMAEPYQLVKECSRAVQLFVTRLCVCLIGNALSESSRLIILL